MLSVKERKNRTCESGCIMWSSKENRCLADYPDEKRREEDKNDNCRYNLRIEECLEMMQKELTSKMAGNPIPNWLYYRIKARFERISPDNLKEGMEDGNEYYNGYCAALEWIKKQTEFPCEGCGLSDCSHHGTQYNCAGNCH